MIQNTTFGSSRATIGASEFRRLCQSKSALPDSLAKKGIQLFEAKSQQHANRSTAISHLAARYPGLAKTLESRPEVAVPTVRRVDKTIRELGKLEKAN